MYRSSRSAFFFLSAFIAAALVLTPFDASQGQRTSHEDEDDAAELDAIEERKRKDPCDRLADLLGRATGSAKKINQRCAHGGGSSGIARGDFNGDGFGDLAIGVPDEHIGGLDDAGAVNVIYGTTDGLCASGQTCRLGQFWSQDSPGVPGASEASDHFGAALAAGDFNSDGCSDLAIGVPGEGLAIGGFAAELPSAGAINIIYGSDSGLVATLISSARCSNPTDVFNGVPAPQFFDFFDLEVFSAPSVEGRYSYSPGAEDGFGSALAWGDFDGDGFADLAIGIPYWDVQQDSLNCLPVIEDAGAVAMLFSKKTRGVLGGFASGSEVRNLLLAQQGIASVIDFLGDEFWEDSVVGMFGGCSNADFDIFQDDWVSFQDSGKALLDAGTPEKNDFFGSTLAAGNFDGAGGTDLAIGIPGEDIQGVDNAGAVVVVYRLLFSSQCSRGLCGFELDQFWSQDESGINGVSESGDGFGKALAGGDFNADGDDDLAVGVPRENLGSVVDAGAVNIIYGSSDGLTAVGDQLLDATNVFPIPNPQEGANFGRALAAGDFDGNGAKDLAIGEPFFDASSGGTTRTDAGRVAIVYSTVGVGLTSLPTIQILIQGFNLQPNTAGGPILGTAEAGDNFGYALTAWNFGRGAQADLAIAAPGEGLTDVGNETPNTFSAAGLVNVLYGTQTPGFLSTVGQQRWTQASPGVPGEIEKDDRFGKAIY